MSVPHKRVTYRFLIPFPANANLHESQDPPDVIGMDSTITEGEGAATSDRQAADASSHNTSATATLNGDENDEIDYSDGEAEIDAKPRETITSATLQEQADGDFIWESEDEDPPQETVVTPPKQSAQVSPTTGKRARSGSDAAEDADAHASQYTPGDEDEVSGKRC